MTGLDVLNETEKAGVQFVRLQFIDILGIMKDVAIPVERLKEALSGGVAFDGSALQGFVRTAESDMRLRPDPGTYAVFPWSDPAHPTARLICSVFHPGGGPFEGCPRWNLQRICASATEMGLGVECEAELEFYLLKPDSRGGFEIRRDDAAGYFDNAPDDDGDEVRRAAVIALRAMGVPVVLSHHENSPGQHEVVLGRAGVIAAADAVMTVKQVTRRVAAQYGYMASFMPKPRTGVNGSGLHLHLHLIRTPGRGGSRGQTNDPGVDVSAFAAGLLDHAGALCAVANPLVNSYKRLVPGYEAPVRADWSTTGRNPFVRWRPRHENDDGPIIEFRGPDSACNPYLTLSCVIQAGIDGIVRELDLPPPSGAEKDALSGQETFLPRTLHESLESLIEDAVIGAALGDGILADYVDAKRIEWQMYCSHVDTWEVHHYLGKY